MTQAAANTESTVITIFGASGDLTRRKLVPALYNLSCAELLPPTVRLLGVAIEDLSDAAFRDRLYTGMTEYSRVEG